LEDTTKMFNENITGEPRVLAEVTGTNHYGIANTNNPEGADADKNVSTLEQGKATETIGRWSAIFMRAHLYDDKDALDYIYSSGDELDPNAIITAVNEGAN